MKIKKGFQIILKQTSYRAQNYYLLYGFKPQRPSS
jgi:hypothetical protein